jgi:hypothetical protein
MSSITYMEVLWGVVIAMVPTYIKIYLSLNKSYSIGKNAKIGCASVMRREPLSRETA